MKAAAELWGKPIETPETDKAIDGIYSRDGEIAHISISGPLSMDGPDFWDMLLGYGGTSYLSINGALDRAKNDPDVKSIVLDIDSPGGAVDGVDQVWSAIRNAGKPVTAHAGSLTASAAYWIASAAGKIYAEVPTSEIGSIGVLVAAYDWSKWEEDIGIKRIVITSSNAPDKAPDLATKRGQDTIRNEIDAIERIFYARISEGRGVSTEHITAHFGKGGLLVASDPSPEHEDAIRVGMIDGLLGGGKGRKTGPFDISRAGNITPIPQSKFGDFEFTEAKHMVPINMDQSPSGDSNNPAQAGYREDNTMKLSEFLAQNPSAVSEIDKLKADARTAGRDEAKAEYSARVDRVIGVITSEAYPANIKALAGDVLAGKKGIDAFDAAVAVFDAETERRKSETAQAETAGIGAVKADRPNGKSDEEKAIEAASQAAIEKAKAQKEEVAKWV